MSGFFIDRPVFAGVVSVMIVIAGLVTFQALPTAQYPEISPPTVQVTANYPGANARVVAETVAAPIEQQVNGVEGMLYMSSACANDGSYNLTVTFEVGTDMDMAAVLVQNRVAIAEPALPEEVKRMGVIAKKKSTNIVMMIAIHSPDGRYDELYLSNFAGLRLKDELSRIEGAGEVFSFGAGDYSMRIWLDPEKLKARGLTTTDVVRVVSEQNVQVAAGQIGAPPAPENQSFQYTINTRGRLVEAEDFGNIVVKADGGRFTRVKDVAEVTVGAKSYGMTGQFDGKPTAILGVYQLPGANALDLAERVREKMAELQASFPEGLAYDIPFDTTVFVRASIDEVIETLFVAVALVFITIFVFLHSWRATLIPALTIPVSLVGTFAAMGAMGFSINMITLFGLVLAIGIVVDDAIVVVENTARNMEEQGMEAKPAAMKAMEEVSGPIIATTLVLLAVFVPTAFLGGITGQLYRQFALTIAVSTVFSSINALTLSPALCGVLLKPSATNGNIFVKGFEWGFGKTRSVYERMVAWTIRKTVVALLIAAVLGLAAFLGFVRLPTGFVPAEDQGYALMNAQLPDAASYERTMKVVDQVNRQLALTEGIKHWVSIPGYSLLDGTQTSNAAAFWVVFEPWEERKAKGLTAQAVIGRLWAVFSQTQEASVVAFAPPAISGLGVSGGFAMQVQDRGGIGYSALEQATRELSDSASAQSGIAQAYTTFRASVPQLFVDIDRVKAKRLGVPLRDVYNTLQAYLGSVYVNDFVLFGRIFQVKVQAKAEFRADVEDIRRLEVRNQSGNMLPLATLATVREDFGPQIVSRYNMYPSAAVNGSAAPGVSSGQSMDLMEQAARANLPQAMGFEWTGLSYQEKIAGSAAAIFALAVLLVYLVLCAQYESLSIPLGVILSVPLALLGTVAAVFARSMDVNVYTQIGIVLLIGLACKNAILIVEFAKENRAAGMTVAEAALHSARLRLRPILMTSFAFILGVFPLVVASGAGAASRQALGTAVFGGMIAATFLTVLFVPVFYVAIQRASERIAGSRPAPAPVEAARSAEG